MLVKSALAFEILILVQKSCYGIDILSKFHQSDYDLKNLRSEISYVNKDLMHSFNIIGYKHNRTTTAFNCTIWPKIDLKNKVEVVIQAYKRASNEYRLFPMRFQINFCMAFQTNALGLKKLKSLGNYSSCNWEKDTLYYSSGFVLDVSHLPPLIPSGEFKLNTDFMLLKQKLATAYLYGEVYYAEV